MVHGTWYTGYDVGADEFAADDEVSFGAQFRDLYNCARPIYVPVSGGKELAMNLRLEVGIMSVDYVGRGKVTPYPASCGAFKPCGGCLGDKREDLLKPLCNGRKLNMRTLKGTEGAIRKARGVPTKTKRQALFTKAGHCGYNSIVS